MLVARASVPTRRTKRLADGHVLTDTEAEAYYDSHPGPRRREAGWEFVLFVCIVPPAAAVVIALLISEWSGHG